MRNSFRSPQSLRRSTVCNAFNLTLCQFAVCSKLALTILRQQQFRVYADLNIFDKGDFAVGSTGPARGKVWLSAFLCPETQSGISGSRELS